MTTVSNPTEVMPDSDLRVEEDVRVDTSHGDHDRFAHYVDKNEMMESHVFGTPIKALCGKVWVPSRDAKRYPVCPECKEIYESLPDGDDDGAELMGLVSQPLPFGLTGGTTPRNPPKTHLIFSVAGRRLLTKSIFALHGVISCW